MTDQAVLSPSQRPATSPAMSGPSKAADAPRPAKAPKLCPDCGGTVPAKTRGTVKVFCSVPCRTRFHKRQRQRGAVMSALVLAWRAGRGSGASAKAAFSELCTIADRFNEEDRKAGRPAASVYTDALLYQGRHIDRARR